MIEFEIIKNWELKLIISFVITFFLTLLFVLISKKYKLNFWSNEKCQKTKKQ